MTSKGSRRDEHHVDNNNSTAESKRIRKKSAEKAHGTHRRIRLEKNYDESDSHEEHRNRKQIMCIIAEKDEQIEKLIKRVTVLHRLNNEFATEHEKLQKEMQTLKRRCNDFEREKENGCDACRQFGKNEEYTRKGMDNLKHENRQLTSDITMMKTLIYRLNVQLEWYQEMLRKPEPSAKGTSNSLSSNRTLPAAATVAANFDEINWGDVHSHVLAPLLNAYQETINEKNDLIRQYESEMNHISGKIKDIIVENEQVHSEADKLKRISDAYTTEKTKLQAQLDVCRNKAGAHSKRADLAKEKLIEVVRYYEQKIQSQSIDMQRIQEAYARTKGEVNLCKTMHQQPEMVIESLKEYQKLFDELKTQHSLEKAKLLDEINSLKENHKKEESEKQSQLQKITEQIATIQSQTEKIKMLETKIEKIRQKFKLLRQSRDILKDRLKSTVTWNRNFEATARTFKKDPCPDLHKIKQLLFQKEAQLQQQRMQHLAEIGKLQRKLNRREETLRKILLSKVKSMRK